MVTNNLKKWFDLKRFTTFKKRKCKLKIKKLTYNQKYYILFKTKNVKVSKFNVIYEIKN